MGPPDGKSNAGPPRALKCDALHRAGHTPVASLAVSANRAKTWQPAILEQASERSPAKAQGSLAQRQC
jgi:hypothetical protein